MAGFFPHTDISFGNYTALSGCSCSGVLNSIVTDVGAGVNGWTLVTDMRNIDYTTYTGSYRTYYVSENGLMEAQQNSNGVSWTFTSASSTGTCNGVSYGYNAYFAFPYLTATLQDISVDGTNWYKVFSTAISTFYLDRPFAQATTFTRNLLTRPTGYIVLKQSGSNNGPSFGVILSEFASGTSPVPYMVEMGTGWNQDTQTMDYWGPWEQIKPFRHWLTPTWTVNYVLCLYPESIMLWAGMVGIASPGGVDSSGAYNSDYSTMFYAGNLDTSKAMAGDKCALWFASTDNSYTGLMAAGPSRINAMSTYPFGYGGSICWKTQQGNWSWSRPGTYADTTPNKFMLYHPVPRGRSYLYNMWGPSCNREGKAELLPLDVYHASGQDSPNGFTNPFLNMGVEFYRGTVNYLRTFSTSPSGLHLLTLGPDQNGVSYFAFRTTHTWEGDGTPHAKLNLDSGTPGTSQASGWPSGFTTPHIIQWDAWGPFSMPASGLANTSTILRWFAIAML